MAIWSIDIYVGSGTAEQVLGALADIAAAPGLSSMNVLTAHVDIFDAYGFLVGGVQVFAAPAEMAEEMRDAIDREIYRIQGELGDFFDPEQAEFLSHVTQGESGKG